MQVTVYMGEGWHSDFRHTHFDRFSPPDFYARVMLKRKKKKHVKLPWRNKAILKYDN